MSSNNNKRNDNEEQEQEQEQISTSMTAQQASQNADVFFDSEPSSSAPQRQVIAVSASKGPTVFFNLARRFLATDEECDLSALEGAIVSAIDAAHLLERSRIARIVRVQTSFVSVEPKRQRRGDQIFPGALSPHQPTGYHAPVMAGQQVPMAVGGVGPLLPAHLVSPQQQPFQPQHILTTPRRGKPRDGGPGRDLRRARIVVTVRRTEEYRQWLIDHPYEQHVEEGDDPPDLGDVG